MKKRILISIGALIVIAALGAYFWHRGQSGGAAAAPYVVPSLTQSYANNAYDFSLKLPADFTIDDSGTSTDASGNASDTIVFQDAQDNGIQVIVSAYPDQLDLTQADIEAAIPSLQIENAQPVDVGDNYQGLAFESDNPAFDGDSREVWFVFHGNLYQISTYARLDPLLKAIFGTWQFF